MRAKSFNPQIFLEFVCYCCFGGLMLHLVSSGKYLSYVTPRMKPYLYFSAIVMLIWACVNLFRLFQPQHKVRAAHCFVLAIPILLLLLPHNPLSTSDLSINYVGGNAFLGQTSQYNTLQKQKSSEIADLDAIAKSDSQIEETDKSNADNANTLPTVAENDLTSENSATSESIDITVPDTQTDVPDEEYSTALPGLDVANKKITISNDDFGLWLSEIYVNMEEYEGYTVEITGYVFKDPEILKEDEFVTARLMMSCCVADLVPAGLLCKYDKAAELEVDSWVTVEGSLFIGEYEYDGQKYDEPQIKIIKITPTEPVEGYVYPY